LIAAGAISALSFDWDTALKASVIAAGTALLKGLIGVNAQDTLGASPLVRDFYQAKARGQVNPPGELR
ncbi:MAG TPA: hypothetical protein VFD94_03530, partial [Jatrophihabitans sp.]|nr:hypothetical protein [Jatrophihabitans sp.]